MTKSQSKPISIIVKKGFFYTTQYSVVVCSIYHKSKCEEEILLKLTSATLALTLTICCQVCSGEQRQSQKHVLLFIFVSLALCN